MSTKVDHLVVKTVSKVQVNWLNWGKADISLVVLISSFRKDGSLVGIETYKTSVL